MTRPTGGAYPPGMHDPTTGLRLKIARHIRDHGPAPGDDTAFALGITTEKFWESVSCPWFDISGKGWILTERGREEAFADG